MIEFTNALFDKLPALPSRKDPNIAALLGFVLGGIGLGIYFVSFVDFLIPIFIAIVLGVTIGDIGVLGGALLSALWGYFRALNSNSKLDAVQSPLSKIS